MSRITRLPQKEVRVYQAKTMFTKDLGLPFDEDKTLYQEIEERLQQYKNLSSDEEFFSCLPVASEVIITVLNLDREQYADSTIVPTDLTKGQNVTFVEFEKLVYNEGDTVEILAHDSYGEIPLFVVVGENVKN